MSGNVEPPRQPVLAGNWKMFKTAAETVQFFGGFKALVENVTHCEIVIAPPFPALSAAVEAVEGTNIKIGAQNLYWKDEGAFTGEVSGPMIAAIGCSHVIVGHSERRQYFGEIDETVNKRVFSALGAGLTPIVCVGESLQDREGERTESVLAGQFDGAMASLTERDFSRIILAYEPVWAIGTGRTATPEIAGDTHGFLRERSAQQFGEDASVRLRILYGGSVKPANVQELMARPEIDGALVGEASLQPESMAAIVNYT